jgi:hypothetical protein
VGGKHAIIVIADEAYRCHMARLLNKSREGRAVLVISYLEILLTVML